MGKATQTKNVSARVPFFAFLEHRDVKSGEKLAASLLPPLSQFRNAAAALVIRSV